RANFSMVAPVLGNGSRGVLPRGGGDFGLDPGGGEEQAVVPGHEARPLPPKPARAGLAAEDRWRVRGPVEGSGRRCPGRPRPRSARSAGTEPDRDCVTPVWTPRGQRSSGRVLSGGPR